MATVRDEVTDSPRATRTTRKTQARQSARPPRPDVPSRLDTVLSYLPRGNLLDDAAWHRRHVLLQWLVLLHVPALFVFGLWRGQNGLTCGYVVAPILGCLALARRVRRRRLASFFVTVGLVYCSCALVGLSGGAIEAHFHFFIIISFIALYQDWVPFLWNIVFTVLSHGLGSAWRSNLIFNHPAAQHSPWLWSLIHGLAVLAACVGMVIFWGYSEDEQRKTVGLRTQIADAEIERRRFTSDLLVNLARRNQTMLHRQLEIINQLEEKERDPDALADLFRLDHLATRIRRNAESLLVLSGEDPPRVWSQPVTLRDVIRAAIAETEDLNRVVFEVDEKLAVLGHLVTGLTHLLAELFENAVRFSPPGTNVTVRVRLDPRTPGAQVLTVEDWGLGMPPQDMVAANEILARPPDVDVSTSRRFGLHVVSRLARRHGIDVRLTTTAVGGVTAVVALPATAFSTPDRPPHQGSGHQGSGHQGLGGPDDASGRPQRLRRSGSSTDQLARRRLPAERPVEAQPSPGSADQGQLRPHPSWEGWWEGEPALPQRRPQANLAPQLRRTAGGTSAGLAGAGTAPLEVPTDPDWPTEALSRYQASRHAALQQGRTPEQGAPDAAGGDSRWR